MFRLDERRGTVLDAHCAEEGLHPVEVALWNGIVLMVVATGAADGEAEENLRRGARDVRSAHPGGVGF